MPDESPINRWPTLRLNPELKERYAALLERSGDPRSLIRLCNDILEEALAQIESNEPSLPASITIHRLRQDLHKPLAGEDYEQEVQASLREIKSELASQREAIEELRRHNPAFVENLQVAEEPPRQRRRR